MHQLNQIETKMKEMESGKFQILCNEILNALGYGMVTNSGGQSGTDKTIKGTPDAYIFKEDGTFIFVEYTVTQSNVFSKFKSDISKCLDEKKTKVPIEKINKIILMYNSILSVGDVNALSAQCKEKDIRFDKFDLSNLALLIHTKFPYLAKDFLGLNIDSGQFLDYKTFINRSKNGMLSTPLDLDIIEREKEIDEALSVIQRSSSLVLSGKSGVGKTRIALEILRRFEESNPDFNVWYVKDLGISLYEDLLKYTGNKKHIIFLDDINKLTAIDAILSYLADNKDRIKLLATVRDYALSSSLTKMDNYIEYSVIEINKLDDNVIEKIAKHNFGINNESYLQRITRLSQGNPRLAVMMSILAEKEKKLSSIDNVSMLLERYYDDVQKLLDDLKDEKKLKALGALSFLDKIHFQDTKNIEILCNLLAINKNELIQQYRELLRMEMVDIYENEVVSVSDQILSVFIFHYVFETKKILDYSNFIKVYFPTFRNRIIQNINSVVTYYNNLDFFSKCIKEVWDEWKVVGNENLSNLMLTFWFVRETETLHFLSQKINGMKSNINLNDDYKLERKENNKLDEVLSTLGQFANSANYKIALEIILNYLMKDLSKIKEVSYTLINYFGYGKNSYNLGYVVEFDLIEKLFNEINNNNNQKVMYQLFSNVASHLLSFDYEYTESLSGKNFLFKTITLINYGKMPNLRSYIWEFIRSCLETEERREYAENILDKYSAGKYLDEDDLYNYDFNKIEEEIICCLNQDSFEDCLLIDSIEQKVFRYKKYSFNMREKSKSNTFNTYKLLSSQPFDYDEDWSLGEAKKIKMLKTFCVGLEQENYYEFFKQCKEIEKLKKDNFDIQESIAIIFSEISEEHRVDILNAYLKLNTPFKINPIEFLQRMLNKYDYSIIKEIINEHSFDDKEYWLYSIISLLPTESADEYAYRELIEYFIHQEKVSVGWFRSLKFLKKFLKIDRNIYVTVSNIIMKKEDEFLRRVYLHSIFRDEENFKSIVQLFEKNHELLVDIYLYLLSIGDLYDLEGKRFLELFKLNESIIFHLCDTLFKRKKYTYYRRDINFDFSFIWGLDRQLILKVVDYIIMNYCEYNYSENLEVLFIMKEEIYSSQDELILDYIKRYRDDLERMKTLFYLIATFSIERRVSLITSFVELNPSIEDFKALPLGKKLESWSGSEIPIVKRKIDFYKKLNQELNGIKFLEHKAYIESIIEGYEKSIRKIKIREFLSDY